MLFNPKKQAIYIFENDPKDKTDCVDECADAWPPVFTKGEPGAATASRVTARHDQAADGKRQVTYAGKPLYYYATRGRGRCSATTSHLNGGLWWVVGAEREATRLAAASDLGWTRRRRPPASGRRPRRPRARPGAAANARRTSARRGRGPIGELRSPRRRAAARPSRR